MDTLDMRSIKRLVSRPKSEMLREVGAKTLLAAIFSSIGQGQQSPTPLEHPLATVALQLSLFRHQIEVAFVSLTTTASELSI